ncbi:TadE/TadG family type IV pilus assembly protein [Oceaniglobus roseus]|uniref:TadE/TadG family type IV pilus assembly protein n=1 Tax=Oceaniglobus roseus TaxID=1737570 RepID=UPI000C7F6EBB|nr:hypothetical protein [Kandeliimicrobium roseum]
MFKTPLRRFLRNSEGSYSVETILLLPMLAWGVLAFFSYFDGLRLANVNIKAAHTIGDVLSRETDPVNASFIDGTDRLLTFLINRPYQISLRVSVFKYNADETDFDLVWSQSRGSHAALSDADAATVTPRLPITANGDSIIVVETWMDYRPPFVMGLSETTFYNFVVTSPRYSPQLKWDDGSGSIT